MKKEYDEEISIGTLLLKVLLKWRNVLVFSIVLAVAVGAVKIAINIEGLKDTEKIAEKNSEYKAELEAYEAQGVELQLRMQENNRNLRIQSGYNNQSMLMKLDSLNEWNGSMNFYIDTDYQILPGMSVQNENPAYKIICAYYDYYRSGEFYNEVLNNLSFKLMEVKYLKEILSLSFDTNRYAIMVNAVADSKENCDELLRVTSDVLQEQYVFVKSSLGEHTIKNSDPISFSVVNTDREAYQIEQQAKEKELKQNIPTLNEEYSQWKKDKTSIEIPLLTVSSAIKDGIKSMIVAGVVSAFLACIVLTVIGFLRGRIINVNDLNQGEYILGELPGKTKKNNFIDRIIFRIFGIVIKQEEYAERISAMALSMEHVLCSEPNKRHMVALVGDVDASELELLAQQINKVTTDKQFACVAGNIVSSANAVKVALEVSAVVLVVKQDVTLKKTYYQLHSKLTACKVKILGTILTNVESI